MPSGGESIQVKNWVSSVCQQVNYHDCPISSCRRKPESKMGRIIGNSCWISFSSSCWCWHCLKFGEKIKKKKIDKNNAIKNKYQEEKEKLR